MNLYYGSGTNKYVAVSFILFGLWPLSDILVNGENVDVDILNYVMNSHIELAYCRLNCFQGDPICWNQCSGKSFGNKASGSSTTTAKVQFTLQPIGLSLLPKDCGLIWKLRLPKSFQPLDNDGGIIYQIYSQDDQGAWHNEGQTRLNWINMTPNSMGRTKTIKLIAITHSSSKNHHPRQRHVGVATIPFPAVKATSVQCTLRKTRESQNQEDHEKKEEKEEQQVPPPQTANFFATTNGLYLGITVGGVCCALVGFGIVIVAFFVKRKRPRYPPPQEEHIYQEPTSTKIYHHSDIEVASNGSFQFHTAL